MSNQRKKRYIDSAVQGALVRRIVLHWLIFFAMAFLALPLWRVMHTTGFSKPFSSLMLEGWAEMAPVFLILFAMLPVFVWDTVKFSHRFAGPMYRISKAIRSLAAGEEVKPIKLRKGDFWEACAADFNVMLERFESPDQMDAHAEARPAVVATGIPLELPTETSQH